MSCGVCSNKKYTCSLFCKMLQKLRISASKPTLMQVTQTLYRSLSMSSSPPHLEITREELPKLPRANFPGKLILITNPLKEEATYKDEIRSLVSNSRVLGIDTETKPFFYSKDGCQSSPVCLVQLANEDLCIMWRLRRQRARSRYVGVDFPPILYSILTSKDILKVGHSSKTDARLLLMQYHINTCNVFDTYDLATRMNFKLKSLRGLTGILLGLHLAKAQVLSNWEKEKLTEGQIAYASTDAWISLQIYKSLVSYAEREGFEIGQPFEDTLESMSNLDEQRRMAQLVTDAVCRRVKRAEKIRMESASLNPQFVSLNQKEPSLGGPNQRDSSVNPKLDLDSQRSWMKQLKHSIAQLFHLESNSEGPAQHAKDSRSSSSKTDKRSLPKSNSSLKKTKSKVAKQSLASENKGKPMASKKSTSKSSSKTISQKKTQTRSKPVSSTIKESNTSSVTSNQTARRSSKHVKKNRKAETHKNTCTLSDQTDSKVRMAESRGIDSCPKSHVATPAILTENLTDSFCPVLKESSESIAKDSSKETRISMTVSV